MKESTLATKLMIGVLCVGVLVYLAVYFVSGFKDDLATAVVYSYSVDLGTEATGIVVRDELVLSDSGGYYVDLVLNEGEKAAAGDAVALLYSDPSALETRQSIRALQAEIEQLEYALSSGVQSADASKLDSQVISSIVNLRSLTASGDLTALEDSVLNLRANVFKRDYSYGDAEAAVQISRLISEKQSQLTSLNQSLSQVSQTVYAPAAGVFSGEVDGYESAVTPAMLDDMTIDQLSALLSAAAPAHSSALGKLITGSTWYLAALFEGEDLPGLSEGSSYTVSFSHDFFGDVPMTLERLQADGGQTLAVFSARSYLADTSLLRVQTVNIVTQQLQGIRVPRKALRVETVDEEVEREDGSTSTVQRNVYYVYTIVGKQAEKQEVRVLHTGDAYYLVEPVDQSSAFRLRSGDTVILNSSGIYDGKVVR